MENLAGNSNSTEKKETMGKFMPAQNKDDSNGNPGTASAKGEGKEAK